MDPLHHQRSAQTDHAVDATQRCMHVQHVMTCMLKSSIARRQHIAETLWVMMQTQSRSPASLHLNPEADWNSGDAPSSFAGLFTNKPASSSAPVVSNRCIGTDRYTDKESK